MSLQINLIDPNTNKYCTDLFCNVIDTGRFVDYDNGL